MEQLALRSSSAPAAAAAAVLLASKTAGKDLRWCSGSAQLRRRGRGRGGMARMSLNFSSPSSSSPDCSGGGDGFDMEMRVLRSRISEVKVREDLDRKAVADEFCSINFASEMLLLQERIHQLQSSSSSSSDESLGSEWMPWEKNCYPAIQLEITLLLGLVQEKLLSMRPRRLIVILSLLSTLTAASSVVLIATLAAMLQSPL